MSPLIMTLALLAAQPAEATAPAAPAAPAQSEFPAGAPRDDYPFVAWCYGALRGYLELHDEVMPEVKRIETTYRSPNSTLAEDLKVYADMQKDGQRQLKIFQTAMTAAEQASLRPLNAVGAEAVRKGRSVWAAGPEVSKARKAQEWMSWTLPARCEVTAVSLEQKSALAAATLNVNAPAPAPEPAPAEAAPPAAPEAPAETAPAPN